MQALGTGWDFFQNEVLGMKWLSRLIGGGLEACGLDTAGKVGGSVQFFLYDTIKIMVLLSVLILIISYIQSYFPPERTKKILGRFHGIVANCIAALLGTVTPFCSCSSIPLFIGFTSAGLPLGVTFSFLISSPMVDLGSLVLLMSIFGWKVAIVYVVLGLVIAVVGGTLIEKLHLEEQVEAFIRNGRAIDMPQKELHFKDRMQYAWEQVVSTAKKVAPYVLIGVGIGSFIHNWIPEEFIVKILGTGNPFGVIIATIAGIPMYADIFGTIPIAEALLAKGRSAWRGAVLYDGCDHTVPALHDHAPQGCKAEAAGHFRGHLHHGHHHCGLLLQRHSIFDHLMEVSSWHCSTLERKKKRKRRLPPAVAETQKRRLKRLPAAAASP